ncbi:hypothetical protein JOF53_006906 [Crossiella equi]|uniref:N-acetyltransferase domain-containing protein n=1 Tax=Crossiella equi TaxID=130796 RepID=A0ABS5AN74_9PSEU|nr:hypothetical protein [Crossiella equi]MBP2478034.1 hypothetical protein [Crossiella equi]
MTTGTATDATDLRIEVRHEEGAGTRLIREMFLELDEPQPELEDEDRGVLGAVVARRGERLVGWAELLWPDAPETDAILQWVLVAREAARVTGSAAGGDERDVAVLASLVRAAVEVAREAGCTGVRWCDTDGDLDRRAARATGASTAQELGRVWRLELAGWQAPKGLPEVSVRELPHVPTDAELAEYVDLCADRLGGEWTVDDVADAVGAEVDGYLTVDLRDAAGAPKALVTAVLVDEDTAEVEQVVHRDSAAAELLALLVTVIEQAKEEVGALVVRELDDPVLAEALAGAGLAVTDQWLVYRLGG